MSTRQPRNLRLFERSPGERAFDRVLASLAGYLLLAFFSLLLNSHTDESPLPRQITWIAFTSGVAAFAFWLWLLRGVVAAWHDPAVRVLRFGSSLLLAFVACIVLSLLRAPFQ